MIDNSQPIVVTELETGTQRSFESIKKAAMYYYGGTTTGRSHLTGLCSGRYKQCKTKYGIIKAKYN